ncbi:MAG: 2-C-methyl-D-erythritol 4-phosphate cytidylyltransferase [Lachnospiraceae bacterium]|nr:2-C-methyl-D-erythritol 4-phosphate cytidylyltransferase [Lachnospiraceae bacterium]
MVIALILSGGTGKRMGTDIPKQYIKVNGRPVISWCMECLATHPKIDAIQIVAEEMWRDTISECIKCMGETSDCEEFTDKFKGFSAPGENRQLSIFNGLKDIRSYAEDSDYVLVHDAARPLLSAQMVTDCINAVTGHDGVIPVLPMKDTVYLSENGKTITSLLNRSQIYAGQAPELFVLGKYYEANTRLMPDEIMKINGSTEPAIMAGMDMAMIPGDERNYKITTKADLEKFVRGIERTNKQL